MTDHLPAYLAAVPLVAGILAPLAGWIGPRMARAWTLCALTLTFALAALVLERVLTQGPWHYVFGGWAVPWGIEYVLDPFGAGMALLVSFFAALNAVYAWSWEESGSGIYQSLYLLCAAGLTGISITGDLFNLYVFLEIASLSAYALVAAGGPKAELASYRYLLVGSVGASLWVLGLGYLYAVTGTLNMADLASMARGVSHTQAVYTGLSFIAAGLAIKMAVFPMHGWQPDAYSEAPAALMPFLSAVSAKVSAYAFFRVLGFIFAQEEVSNLILKGTGWAGILTMLAGSALALREKNLRRILAYSSVSQIGYVLFGFSLGNAAGLTGAFLHLVNHAVMKSCLFMAAGRIQRARGSSHVGDLKGLAQAMPLTAACFSIAALAMIGFPPGGAFFSKWYLLEGALESGHGAGAAALAVSSLISAVYFFRILEALYSSEEQPVKAARQQEFTMQIPMAVLSAGVLLLGFFNETLAGWARAALP